jgi:Fe-S-cluster containining protein
MSCNSACTGRCCEKFTIPYSREHIRKNFQHQDGEFIADMLIPLGVLKEGTVVTDELKAQHGQGVFDGVEALHNDVHIYTCRHYDTENRACTVYDERPSLCSTFPNHGDCPFDCGLGEGGQGVETEAEAAVRVSKHRRLPKRFVVLLEKYAEEQMAVPGDCLPRVFDPSKILVTNTGDSDD